MILFLGLLGFLVLFSLLALEKASRSARDGFEAMPASTIAETMPVLQVRRLECPRCSPRALASAQSTNKQLDVKVRRRSAPPHASLPLRLPLRGSWLARSSPRNGGGGSRSP